ncbi:MAG: CHASE2 domain-containing sensor protein [Saprospiraceae bacterium]
MLATLFLFILHHLPIYQIFIDPFSEAIKNHDVMDVAFSKFRNHDDPTLFDPEVFIINSEITDREQLANAIDIVIKKQAAVVGVDLLFDKPNYDKADTLLRAALQHEKVIIGYTFEETQGHTSISSDRSSEFFSDKTQSAFVNLGSNDGFSVRTFEPFHEIDGQKDLAFAVKVASYLDPEIPTILKERHLKKEWINFRRKQPGKLNSIYPINNEGLIHYAMVDISDFIAEANNYKDDYFRDKIVLIGFNGDNNSYLSMQDRYFTPLNEKYSGRSLPDMHGVIIHANIISMLLDKDYINDTSEKYLYLIAFLIFFINFMIFDKLVKKNFVFTVATARLIQVVQFIILFTISVYMITYMNRKIGFVLIITAVVLSFELYEYYHHRLQSRFTKLLNYKRTKKIKGQK